MKKLQIKYHLHVKHVTISVFSYISNVKKYIAVLLVFIFTSASTSLGEWLRLPTLIHHYFEHVEWDNTSFLQFLAEHYAKNINHPDDSHHDHENLPFKTTHCYSLHWLMGWMDDSTVYCSDVRIFITENFVLYYQSHYSNAHLNSIWQPPRA